MEGFLPGPLPDAADRFPVGQAGKGAPMCHDPPCQGPELYQPVHIQANAIVVQELPGAWRESARR